MFFQAFLNKVYLDKFEQCKIYYKIEMERKDERASYAFLPRTLKTLCK